MTVTLRDVELACEYCGAEIRAFPLGRVTRHEMSCSKRPDADQQTLEEFAR